MAKRKNHSSRTTLASVHRFRDMVAVYAAKDDGTLYMTAKDARAFAEAILVAVSSVESEKFVDSNVPQYILETHYFE